jgi:hypothetical protein
MTMATITTLDNNTITITTTHTLNANEFWEAITGSDFYGCDDFVVPSSLTTNEKKMSITLKYFDVNNFDENGHYRTIREVITLEKLVIAYNTLLNDNQTHCGGHSLNYHDYDGCFGYLVLQQACYGEIVF